MNLGKLFSRKQPVEPAPEQLPEPPVLTSVVRAGRSPDKTGADAESNDDSRVSMADMPTVEEKIPETLATPSDTDHSAQSTTTQPAEHSTTSEDELLADLEVAPPLEGEMPPIMAALEDNPDAAPRRPELLMTAYLENSDMAVSFADPHLPDEPLIHVNDAFCKLTGHKAAHCLLRNCRFLQGELTRRSETSAIRQGIKGDFYLITRLLNYRRNGELFDNVVQIGQVRDTGGHTRFLFGLQWDVTRTLHLLGGSSMEADLVNRSLTPELERLSRLANHLVRRSDALGVGAAGVPLVERLVAMSRPFQFPTTGPQRDRATLRALIEYLLQPHMGVIGSRIRINGTDGIFDTDIAGPLALWVHELASASKQYGALSQSTGVIILSWDFPYEGGRPMIAFHWQEVKFAALPGNLVFDSYAPANVTGGTGARVVQDVVEFAGGRTTTRAWDDKLDSILVLPNEVDLPAR